MKDLKLSIPLLLLITYVLTLLYKGATISDGIVVVSICSVYSISIWLSFTKVEANKAVDPELERQFKMLETLRIQKEINSLQHDLAKMAAMQNVEARQEKRSFTF